jgi:twitching motility protein PilU
MVIIMNSDINKAAVEKITQEEKAVSKPESTETVAADLPSQGEATMDDTQIIDLSGEGMEALQQAATAEKSSQGSSKQADATTPLEYSGKVENVNSEPPENKTEKEEPMKVAQQAEKPAPEAFAEEDSALETMVQDTTQNDENSAEPAMEQSSVNDDGPAAKPAKQKKSKPIDITPYLKLMVEKQGSDMYFTCGAKVQIKINGVTMGIGNSVLPKGAVYNILPGILNERQLAEFDEEMELDTAFSLNGIGRFRINVFRQRGEVAIVIRQIHAQVPSVQELQLPTVIESLIMEPRGLIIIAGATGTGKSTTVASMIDHRNSRQTGHILTIEDPIEFIHDHKKSIVNQREVGLDTKSFKEALRRAMREAPDVIMIGEIRDAETMHQALSYADTGHLCIATLHATNAIQCMERIIALFPEANRDQLLMDLSLNLRALVCQRLLIGANRLRVPATEVLMNEPMVQKVIREGETHKLKEILEKAPPESPLHSFDNDMLRLYQAKKVTMEEALRHADEPDHFKLKVNLGGGSAGGFSSTGVDFD